MRRAMRLLAGVVCGCAIWLGCTTTLTREHRAAGEVPLCSAGVSLGHIAVLTETAWRADQKDLAERNAMVAHAVEAAFAAAATCPDAIAVHPVAAWAPRPEGERTAALAKAGVDTAIFVRVEELGPTIALTLSLPLLWTGASEAEVSLRAIHVPTGRVLLDTHVERVTGGPFQLRPAGWAEAELVAALVAVLEGA